MKMNKKYVLLACLTVFLSACDHKEKLEGKREEILAENYVSMKIDPKNLRESIVVPSSSSVLSYKSINGDYTHDSVNHAFPSDFKKLWSSDLGRSPIASEIIHDGEKVYSIDAKGTLKCINPKNGAILWSIVVSKQSDDNVFSGGMTISGDKIVITTNKGEVIVFNKNTKKEILKHEIKIPIKSAPIVKNDTIIVTTIDNKTFALDINAKKMKWAKVERGEETIMQGASVSALYTDKVICTYTNGDVSAIDLQTGSEIWNDTLFSGNTSKSGFVISHIVASPVVHNGVILASSFESKTVALDAESGVRVWENGIGTFNTPAVINNWAFMINSSGSVSCVSMKDGSLKWNTEIKNEKGVKYSEKYELFGPVILNGKVTVFASDGSMFTLDIQKGTILSRKTLDCRISNTPVIVGKIMYVVDERAKLYAFG